MPALFPVGARRPRWRAAIAAATVAGLVLGVLGPFGSYLDGGPVLRAVYWVGAMWIGLLLYGAGFAVSRRVAAAQPRAAWFILAVSVLVASVPETALTRLAAFRLWPELARMGFGWTTWYVQVITIELLTTIGVALATCDPTRLATPNLPADQGLAATPIVPGQRLRGDVLALQMEDHYVRIHTKAGSELILMPLGRAIDLVKADGLRTHRSWWVARHAVERVEGAPRSMSLRLTNGILAPVSRNSVASLRAAGWL